MTAPSSNAASKAAGFSTVVGVLRELSEAPSFARCAAALPSETAALLEIPPIAIAWLPIDHFYALVDTAHRVLFAGDDARVVDLGRRSIARDIGTIYRVFIRFASPEHVMSRTAQLWGAYNRDHGAVSVVMRTSDVADVTYSGIPSRAPAAFWLFQRGALHAVVEATGVGKVSTQLLTSAGDSTTKTIRVSGATLTGGSGALGP